MAESRRPRRLIAVGGLARTGRDWDSALFGILLGFSVFSDLTAIETNSRLKISGSFLALVLAMVFLGGAPAALIGVLTILARLARAGATSAHDLLNNLVTYATFPLLTGIAFHSDGRTRGRNRRRPDLLPPGLRRLPAGAGAQLHDDRRLRLLPRAQLVLRPRPARR